MRTLLAIACLASLGFAPSCKGAPPSTTVIVPASDTADSGFPFDPDEIVPSAGLTDDAAETTASIQTFLEHDPYAGSSFLATYQSNGVLFSAAVTNAATAFRINPIVLLVAVEAQGGLVADATYPQSAPFLIDYLFGCGCGVPSMLATCAPSAAGLDVQLGCYADALRTSLDQIASTGETTGGWGPGKTGVTLDGVTVIPRDDSTAALYAYDPVVGHGESGNSLFANIWREYTLALSYGVPLRASGGTGIVGDPCVSAADCGFDHAVCATGASYPGGMCTSPCAGACPGVDAFCADFTQGGFCLTLCSPANPASCRTGYACTYVKPSGAPAGTSPENVCVPK